MFYIKSTQLYPLTLALMLIGINNSHLGATEEKAKELKETVKTDLNNLLKLYKTYATALKNNSLVTDAPNYKDYDVMTLDYLLQNALDNIDSAEISKPSQPEESELSSSKPTEQITWHAAWKTYTKAGISAIDLVTGPDSTKQKDYTCRIKVPTPDPVTKGKDMIVSPLDFTPKENWLEVEKNFEEKINQPRKKSECYMYTITRKENIGITAICIDISPTQNVYTTNYFDTETTKGNGDISIQDNIYAWGIKCSRKENLRRSEYKYFVKGKQDTYYENKLLYFFSYLKSFLSWKR